MASQGEETISIIRIETGQAVKSVNELRENVKILKERLGDLQIGSTEYQDTLEKLNENQRAIKDAMYATSASMEEVAANAKGINVVFDENNKLINQENQSYNALVNTMAELKTQWRSTSDEAQRANLGQQIKQINDQLKDMDASVGNYSRSVGDYTNSVKKALGDFPKFADPAKNALKAVNDTTSLLAGNPIMGIIALVTPLIVKITESLKEDETSMGAIKALMDSIKPIMDFFQGILENVVSFLAEIITKAAEFLGSSGIFQKIIKGVVGVGNSILQFMIAPIKGVVAAVKVLQDEGVKGIKNAAKAMNDEFNKGISFKDNFETGAAMTEKLAAGAKSKKSDMEKAGKEVGDSFAKGLEKSVDDTLKRLEKRQDQMLKDQLDTDKLVDEWQEEFEDEMEDYWEELEETERRKQVIREYEEEQERLHNEAILEADRKLNEDRAKIAQQRIDTIYAVADATASVLGSLADLYEADEENAQKNAEKVKGLRIAAATIDTIQGAVTAFAQAQQLGPIAGPIVGAINAAAVTAAGIAQIAKIKSTKVNGSSTTSPGSIPAVANAPVVSRDIPQVRSVTSASEEERLNQMASDQRVVLVMSDLEVKQNQSKVQVAEASF